MTRCRRLVIRLVLCALALAVSIGIAAALIITKNQQKAAEAAAASEAAARAAEEEAARAASEAAAQAAQEAENERLVAEAAAAKRAEQIAAALDARDRTQYGDKLGRIWIEEPTSTATSIGATARPSSAAVQAADPRVTACCPARTVRSLSAGIQARTSRTSAPPSWGHHPPGDRLGRLYLQSHRDEGHPGDGCGQGAPWRDRTQRCAVHLLPLRHPDPHTSALCCLRRPGERR